MGEAIDKLRRFVEWADKPESQAACECYEQEGIATYDLQGVDLEIDLVRELLEEIERESLTALGQRIHAWAKAKGWWDGGPRSVGDQFANFHAEISEAWEEYRKFGMTPGCFIYLSEDEKPEGIAVELADAIIRILDTCQAYNIPLVEAIHLKLAHNDGRPYRHGNKFA